MERKLIKYLPSILQPYREIQAITVGQQWLLEQLWTAVDRALNNQFVSTADDYGIKRWESMLSIKPKGTDTLDERRFRIIARLNEQLPFTYRMLKQQMHNLCGDGYEMALAQNGYVLVVRIELTNHNNYSDVQSLLQRVVPANIKIDLSLRYNTHSVLAAYTHAQLAAFTHEELRVNEFDFSKQLAVNFNSIDEIVLSKGIWNAQSKRIEC